MSKKTKIWLIIGASLILIGAIIFVGAMMALNWDFTKLSTVKYETNHYEISESFKNINVLTDTANITFVPSENSKVVCYEENKVKHLVTVQDDTLVIEASVDKKWYEHIGINFGTPKITVYIPAGEYGALTVKASTSNTEIPKDFKFESVDISQSTGGVKCFASASGDIKIKTSTGKIALEKITAASLEIKVSTGEANISNTRCNDIISTGSTGDITLKNVIANENISIKRSTGDVKFEGCDAGEIVITTDTGDVKGSLLSDKIFITESDTGSIKVPESVSGGKCKITTDTGNIKIEIIK